MLDMTRFVELMKKQAADAVAAGDPVHILYGTVGSVNPLVVITDQQLRLERDVLILPEYLTDHTVRIGERNVMFYGALKAGDKLILLRQQGGQSFLALDRVAK